MAPRIFVASLTVLMLAPAASSPAGRLAAEITRLQHSEERLMAARYRAHLLAGLKRAADALTEKRLYLALYELEEPFAIEHADAFVAASRDVRTTADFAATWRAFGLPPVHTGCRDRRQPLVVEALAVAAESQVPATYRASLPYAEDAGIASGLYYLGRARALARFAAFCRSMDWPNPQTTPSLRSIAPEVSAFEAVVVDAYEKVPAPDRRVFIAINAALKLARDLNSGGAYAAAILEYLRARYSFGLLTPRPQAYADADRAALARARAALPGAVDHTIPVLFLELADAESGATAGRSRTAVLDDVLPAYFELVKR